VKSSLCTSVRLVSRSEMPVVSILRDDEHFLTGHMPIIPFILPCVVLNCVGPLLTRIIGELYTVEHGLTVGLVQWTDSSQSYNILSLTVACLVVQPRIPPKASALSSRRHRPGSMFPAPSTLISSPTLSTRSARALTAAFSTPRL
jgi:hypothetical protein